MLLIALDWDETITASDTLSLIAPPPSPTSATSFETLSEAYMSLISAHNAYYDRPRTTLAEECDYLSSVEAAEVSSLDNVESSGLFKGVNKDALLNRAAQVSFRNGWPDASLWLARMNRQGLLRCDVISIGWSSSFIRAGLRDSVAGGVVPTLVLSNEIEFDETGQGTGRIRGSPDLKSFCPELGEDGKRRAGMRTALDKLQVFSALVSSNNVGQLTSVYVGDSSTDVPCLLYADLGIIVGNQQSSPVQLLTRIGMADQLKFGVDQWNTERPRRAKPLRAKWSPGQSLEPLQTGSVVIVVSDWMDVLQVFQTIRL